MNFYTSVEQAIVHQADSMEIDTASPALKSIDSFLVFDPDIAYQDSPIYKAIQLFKEILFHYQATGNISALIDADLHRLTFIGSVATIKGVRKVFIKRFSEMLEKYKNSEMAATISYRLASALYDEGDWVEAYRVAQTIKDSVSDSLGYRALQKIMRQITIRELLMSTENVHPPEKPRNVNVTHRNIKEIYFKIVKDDWKRLINRYDYQYYNDSLYLENLFLQKPVRQWKQQVNCRTDHKSQIDTITMPKLKPGYYRLFASSHGDGDSGVHTISSNVWITPFTAIIRNDYKDGYNGLVVNSVNGKPMRDVKVTLCENYSDKFLPVKQCRTNSNGYFSILTETNFNKCRFLFQTGKGLLFNSDFLDCSNGNLVNNKEKTIVLITDRSVYRPGQKIRYKGICANVNQMENNYSVVSGDTVRVSFLDAHEKIVAIDTLITNEFGSFSGDFVAPQNSLNGIMRIQANSYRNSKIIRVEEYKRPTFLVEVNNPIKEYRLNDTVIVNGKALSYTGAPVSGAHVRFKISRSKRYPKWWRYWHFKEDNKSDNFKYDGNTVTAENGCFEIRFIAVPDSTCPAENMPVFTYDIQADVTASDGETRSQQKKISLGYSPLELHIEVPSLLQENKPFSVRMSATTLDGGPLSISGRVKLYRLKQPQHLLRIGFLQSISFGHENIHIDTIDGFSENWIQWPLDTLISENQFSNDHNNNSAEYCLESGLYKLETVATDRFGKEVFSYIPVMIFPGKRANRLNLKIPSFAAASHTIAEVGDTVRFLWGTGYKKGQAFIEIEHLGKTVQGYWTKPLETVHQFSIPVEEKHRGGFSAHITFVHEKRTYYHPFSVSVPWTNKEIVCSLSTFRSSMEPGSKETWSVTLKGKVAQLKEAEAVVTMYDRSLDQIYPNQWGNFTFFRKSEYQKSVHVMNTMSEFDNWKEWPFIGPYPKLTYNNFSDDIDWSRYRGNSRGVSGIGYGCEYGVGGFGMVDDLVGGLMGGYGGGLLSLSKQISLSGMDSIIGTIAVRKNLEETAFFYPHLTMDDSAKVTFECKMPEALTSWNMFFFAHGKNCENGGLTAQAVTRKKLMIQPNVPRFLRELDTILFSARVSNLSDTAANVTANLTLKDFVTKNEVDSSFRLNENKIVSLEVPAKSSKAVFWKIQVPNGCTPIEYIIKAATDNCSDGESGVIPVLSSRIFVTESIPINIYGPSKATINLEKVKQVFSSENATAKLLSVQMTSNPAWQVVRSLPYLIEYPYECSEQIFNRYYGNCIARHLLSKYPDIGKIFERWHKSGALKSELEKNEHLMAISLEETPWLLNARKETTDKQRMADLLTDSTITKSISSALNLLKKRQLPEGAWPWFNDTMDLNITCYIAIGLGKLNNLGIKIDDHMAFNAIDYLDRWLRNMYVNRDNPNFTSKKCLIPACLYARSFFLSKFPQNNSLKKLNDYYLNWLETEWTKLNSLIHEGQAALTLFRFGKQEYARKMVLSLNERSKFSIESGRWWPRNQYWWYWDHAPIETQALMIDVFDEISHDTVFMDECKKWLINQKRFHCWGSTKATADAIYAFVARGENLLSDTEFIKITLNNDNIVPDTSEAGTGYYEKTFTETDIKPGPGFITVIKNSKGPAWGGIHLQYLQNQANISKYETDFKIEKQIYVTETTSDSENLKPVTGPIRIGDLVTIRLLISTKHEMEYVHVKDLRGSGLEPLDALSGYRFCGSLGYYQMTKDAASHFFIAKLPKGNHVIEYQLRTFHAGKYQSGTAQIQCMYAPEFNSHSESIALEAVR